MEKNNFFKTNIGLISIGLVFLIIGFVGGMEYKAQQIRNVLSTIDQNLNTDTSESQTQSFMEQIKQEGGNIIDKNIGDMIELATINMQIEKVEESNLISPSYGSPIIAQQNSKFVFITLNLTNTTKSDFTWYSDLDIVDNQDRNFTPYGNAIGNVKNYIDMRKLSPAITENGVMTYQLPTSSEQYYLVIGKGGTNDYFRIKLK